MFKAQLTVKVWAYTHAVNCGDDWFIDRDSLGTYDQALASQYCVAAVPVMFNRPENFTYQAGNELVDLSQFDLVLLSDIEYRSLADISAWADHAGIKKWILAAGGFDTARPLDYTRCVYRPWWIYNRDIKFNSYQEVRDSKKSFVCDALLGSRRPNRDFVMMSMQQHNLLDRNIVTYRDVFTGNSINTVSQQVADYFSNMPLQYPYVSPNLDPAWEVSDNINHSVSQTVPWEIYRHTAVSLAVESVSTGSMFFMAEKISKPMMAARPFIVFGIRHYVRTLQQLGFKTFHPYIDESYDDIDNDLDRWSCAFEQVVKLHDRDIDRLYLHLEDRIQHNANLIKTLESQANNSLISLLRQHIDAGLWLN